MTGLHRRMFCLLLMSAIMISACGSGSTAEVASAEVSDGGFRLRLLVNTCNASHATTVTDAGDHVELEVTATGDTPNDCQDSIIVVLPARLDGRDLIDRSTGDPIAVSPSSDYWPYDRDRFSLADYAAALAEMVVCIESRDPQIEAWITERLNWPTYKWYKEPDERGNTSAPAISDCAEEHLHPLRG